MWSQSWLRVATFVALTLSVVALSGCVKIEVIDRTPSIGNQVPIAVQESGGEHDLAVLAVDFDPPLEYEEIIARRDQGEGITLLVAVENMGLNTEQDVEVQVALSKDKDATPFLQKQGSIESIAPGEIKIVHFKDTEIPFSYKYRLQVQVVSVAQEVRISDNLKSYDLLITQP